jgi:hypothetical protein
MYQSQSDGRSSSAALFFQLSTARDSTVHGWGLWNHVIVAMATQRIFPASRKHAPQRTILPCNLPAFHTAPVAETAPQTRHECIGCIALSTPVTQ